MARHSIRRLCVFSGSNFGAGDDYAGERAPARRSARGGRQRAVEPGMMEGVPETVYSVGHSNLEADGLFAPLGTVGIRALADVRAFPASRRHPHFRREALAESCAAHGIAYQWMPALGGRRRARRGPSPHVAWEVPGFRSYADYADTEEFATALAELERVARATPTAFMCAEALWWRCHRRLIADRLLLAGWDVRHIGPGARLSAHRLPEFARVVDGRIIYDVGVTAPLELG